MSSDRRWEFSDFVACPRIRLYLLLTAMAWAGEPPAVPGFHVAGTEAGPWPSILESYGLRPQPEVEARVLVQPSGESVPEGRIVVLEGDSEMARALGFRMSGRRVRVDRVLDRNQPRLRIVWESPADVPVFRVPPDARVLAVDRSHGVPLAALLLRGAGSVLWLAISPGVQGHERFPFLLDALRDAGVQPLLESRRLWAFFDSALQRGRDPGALAREWRQMGIEAIHAGAWDYFEPDPESDAFLNQLIDACHRQCIRVYAWLELPHVSTEFWNRHPQWREKTARLKDAAVDWRLLMNLENPDCRRAVQEGVRSMLARFDWDGVNLAELYFESPDGIRKPKEFTPMNDDVRQEVRRRHGFDPIVLFDGKPRDPVKMRTFLDYRVGLAARIQEEWIADLENERSQKPDLDLVLTHVDDRFDKSMRDAIGADAARLLKSLDGLDLTFVIEDPYTLWHLGPKRYAEIAEQYRPLTPRQDRLGVDINIVKRERRQHPTSKQTGVELAELIHIAAQSFATVMFYYTGSITPAEAPLLPAASAVVTRCERSGDGLLLESPYGVGVRWSGPVTLDGAPWPVRDAERVWVPAGRHVLRAAQTAPPVSVTDFTGALTSAAADAGGVNLSYRSTARAFVRLDRKPIRLTVDGRPAQLDLSGDFVVHLPRGSHRVRVDVDNR